METFNKKFKNNGLKKFIVLISILPLLASKNFEQKVFCESNGVKTQDFKNVKEEKEGYEVDGFKSYLYKKNGNEILLYQDVKTKAFIIFNLSRFNDKTSYESKIFFNCPSSNDKGEVHALEHLLASPVLDKLAEKYKSISYKQFNGVTIREGLYFTLNNSIFSEKKLGDGLENLKFLFDELKQPSFYKDGEIFKREVYNKQENGTITGRMYFEMANKKGKDSLICAQGCDDVYRSRFFYSGGDVNEIPNLNSKSMEKLYEEYIHPSNCLMIFNVGGGFETIKQILEFTKKNYLGYYEKKDIEVNYKTKKNSKIIYSKIDKNSDVFKHGNDASRYAAKVCFDAKDFSGEQKDILNFEGTNMIDVLLKDEIEKMGYSSVENSSEDIYNGRFYLNFHGDNPEQFEESLLKRNAREILEKLNKKIKDFLGNYDSSQNMLKMLKNSNSLFRDGVFSGDKAIKSGRYRNFRKFEDVLFTSFALYGEPFSEKVLQIENGNIIEDKESVFENVEKEVLKKEILNTLSEKNISFVNVYEQSDVSKKKEKSNDSENFIPIKLTNYNLNGKESYDLFRFAEYILFKFLINPAINDKGLSYKIVKAAPYFKSRPFCDAPTESINSIKSYLNSKEFKEKIDKFKLNEPTFVREISKYSKILLEDFSSTQKCVNYLQSFRTKLLEKLNELNGRAIFNKAEMLNEIEENIKECNVLFVEKDDYRDALRKEKEFKKSFKKDMKKNKNEENKEFLILLSEYISYKITLFNASEKEIKNRIDNIKKLNLKDVNESLKSVKILKEDE